MLRQKILTQVQQHFMGQMSITLKQQGHGVYDLDTTTTNLKV